MAKRILTDAQLEAFCDAHGGWSLREGVLTKSFPLATYTDGLVLIARIVVEAELANHHPDIEYSYGAVRISLTTHDAGGVTKLDTVLAEKIDSVVS